jgi:hypothetical protein
MRSPHVPRLTTGDVGPDAGAGAGQSNSKLGREPAACKVVARFIEEHFGVAMNSPLVVYSDQVWLAIIDNEQLAPRKERRISGTDKRTSQHIIRVGQL